MTRFSISNANKLWSDYYFLVTIILSAFISIYGITGMTVQIWDEGRQAVNALEMFISNDFIITTYNDEPDLWNTKPPFLIWLITLSFKLFGPTDFALRLPGAISIFLLTILIFNFVKKHSQSSVTAFFSSMIIITCGGIIRSHVSRTADYDALLVLSITAYSLNFFDYLYYRRKKYLLYFSLCLAVGGLTKGIAALIPLPALALYLLFFYPKRILDVKLYLSGIAALIIILSFYILREYSSAGYIQAVYNNELGGRFASTIEEHSHPWYYYLQNTFNVRFFPWFLTLPVIGYFIIKNNSCDIKKILYFSLIVAIWIFSILSVAKTKLNWYHAPVFPFLAIAIAISISEIFSRRSVKYGLMGLLVLIGLIHTISGIRKENINSNENKVRLAERFSQSDLSLLKQYSSIKFFYPYNSPILFKLKSIQVNNPEIIIKYVHMPAHVNPSDTLLLINGLNDQILEGIVGDTLLKKSNYIILKNIR